MRSLWHGLPFHNIRFVGPNLQTVRLVTIRVQSFLGQRQPRKFFSDDPHSTVLVGRHFTANPAGWTTFINIER
jgi:hypothetical protein